MTFSHHQTRIIKGMLERGNKQHDIAAYFGVNGGRIAEVATNKCDYPNAQPLPENELPPNGPYASPYDVKRASKKIADLLGKGPNTSDKDIKKLFVIELYEIQRVFRIPCHGVSLNIQHVV